jgi:hypothetical protein
MGDFFVLLLYYIYRIICHLPQLLVSLQLNTTIAVGSVTLEWTVSDADGDALTIDIFLELIICQQLWFLKTKAKQLLM